ncbi:MAG TPA: glycosyltransferase family 39 protein, partial [Polyangiaceae bacterium]|nr:glycosyltransferase family 39 protein [Polyangiaceae bacterium]
MAWLQQALDWVIANQDMLLVCALWLLCIARRVQDMERIELEGDAIRKWQFVRSWFYANDYSHAVWDHHMTRFGVTLPTFIVQLICGRGTRAYHVTPLVMSVLQIPFVYLIGKQLSGRFAGVLSAIFLIHFSGVVRAASQLLPDGFVGTYVLVGLYCLIRYLYDPAPPKNSRWLVASGASVFAAYLAKETALFYLPGFLLAIGVARKNWRDLLLFCGVLLLGLAIESAGYALFTKYWFRIQVVLSGAFQEGPPKETTFWGLFGRYAKLDQSWKFAFDFFIAASIAVWLMLRGPGVRALLLICWSHYFFLTFAVAGIDPIRLVHQFRDRYLDSTAPMVELTTGIFVTLALRELWQRHFSV